MNGIQPIHVISSPLRRAIETAKVATGLKYRFFTMDADFREIETHYQPDDVITTIDALTHFDWQHGCPSDQNVYAHAFKKIPSSFILLSGHHYSFQCFAREFGWNHDLRCCELDNGAIVEFYIVRTAFGVYGLFPKILFKGVTSDCHRIC